MMNKLIFLFSALFLNNSYAELIKEPRRVNIGFTISTDSIAVKETIIFKPGEEFLAVNPDAKGSTCVISRPLLEPVDGQITLKPKTYTVSPESILTRYEKPSYTNHYGWSNRPCSFFLNSNTNYAKCGGRISSSSVEEIFNPSEGENFVEYTLKFGDDSVVAGKNTSVSVKLVCQIPKLEFDTYKNASIADVSKLLGQRSSNQNQFLSFTSKARPIEIKSKEPVKKKPSTTRT